MMRVERRPLRHDDIAALQVLDRAAHGEAWSRAAFVAQIDDPAFRHLVALDTDGVVLGHAATWADGGHVRLVNVACAVDASGRGVASRLLLDLFVGVDADRLSLEVRPRNRRAQRLYGRFGFVPAGVARGFYDRADVTGSVDALVMVVPEPRSPAWRQRLATIAGALDAEAAA